MNGERISSRQLTWLLIIINISTSTALVPGIVIFYARQSAWLAILLAAAAAAAGVVLNLTLAGQFPGQTVAQYAQGLLGTWLGRLAGFFYSLTCLYLVAVCIRTITQVIKLSIMPETPLWPFVTGFVLLTVYSAWLGLEPLARAGDIMFPFALLVLTSLFLLALPEGKLYRALPVLQFNPAGIVKGAFPSFACLGESFVILLLAPALNKPAELKSASLKGSLLSGLILVVLTQTLLFVQGTYRTSAYLFPILRTAGELNVLDVFERFAPFVLTAWFTVNSVKIGVLAYCFALSASQTIGLKSCRPALLAALVAIPLLSLAPRSLAESLTVWVDLIAFKILIPTAFLFLPALLLLIAKVKKHHG